MSDSASTPCAQCGGAHADGAPCPAAAARRRTPTMTAEMPTIGSRPPEAVASTEIAPTISVRSFDLPPGTLVGEYQVLRRIGAGTMGVVYEGVHPLIERKVAIKVLSPDLAASQDAADKLIQEARASNRVGHHNIVDVYSIGALPDGRLYLVMEFLEGKSLEALIEGRGPLPFAEAMVIVEAVLGALDAAHRAGVIHRDLKPENIFVLPGPDDSIMRATVKILDFGLAKVRGDGGKASRRTFTGLLVGTPAYMSPEQCRAIGELDARSDLYSFGVILYFMLTGRLPFDAPSYIDVINLQLTAPPPPPSSFCGMPSSVEEVILKLLEKDPAHRYPNAEAVRVVLKACSDAWTWVPGRTAVAGVAEVRAGGESAPPESAAAAPLMVAPATPSDPAGASPSALAAGGMPAEAAIVPPLAVVTEERARKIGLALGGGILGALVALVVAFSNSSSRRPVESPVTVETSAPSANPAPAPAKAIPATRWSPSSAPARPLVTQLPTPVPAPAPAPLPSSAPATAPTSATLRAAAPPPRIGKVLRKKKRLRGARPKKRRAPGAPAKKPAPVKR